MSKRDITGLFFTILCIGVYFWLFRHYAINIPKWDDHALKSFILNYEAAPHFQAKVFEIVKQHNEHRIGLTRLIALIDFKIFGEINYIHLMFVGNLALVLIWWLFTRFFKPLKGRYSFSFSIALSWFSLAFYENTFWGMAAIQNFWIIAFAMLTFWIISLQNKHWPWATLVTLFAIYTSGNGLFLLPLVLIVLLLQKRFRPALIWTAVSVLFFSLYFYDYQNPPTSYATNGDITTIVKGVLYCCGSMAEGLPFHSNPTQLVLGSGIFTFIFSLFILLYIIRSYIKRYFVLDTFDYFYLSGTLFALGTIFLITYSRAGGGTELLLVSRYKLYSAMLISFNLGYLIRLVSTQFREVINVTLIVVQSFAYISLQHYFLQNTIENRRFMTTMCFNWENEGASSRGKSNPIYNEPPLFIDVVRGYKADTAQSYIQTALSKDNILSISYPDYQNNDLRDGGGYIVLANQSNRYVFPLTQKRKHSIRNLLNYNRFFQKGANLTIDINTAYIKPGRYVVSRLENKSIAKNPTSFVIIPPATNQNPKQNW